MFTILIVGCGIFGLAVGSFLNVVIYRVPLHKSIVSPGSACPSCGAMLKPLDNIPLLSWLVLRAKCRTCGVHISARYPLVELGTAALFAGEAARLGTNWALPAYLVLIAGLVALSWIDVEHLILPKVIVYPLMIMVGGLLVLAAGETHQWHRLLIAAVCAVVWYSVFFLLNLINPKWLGFGDVRLAPVLGLALGWLGVRYVLLGFFLANVVGALVGIYLISSKRISRDQPIPYGVFLALGTVLTLYVGSKLLVPFQNLR